jgi:hypothetical protein
LFSPTVARICRVEGDTRHRPGSDLVYKPGRGMLDRGRLCAVDARAILAQAMADGRGETGRQRNRARPNDALMQEVRWRLFRREDMPARLRRLERMEDTAFSERPRDGPPDRDGGEPGG